MTEQDYEKLLEQAYKEVKQVGKAGKRFEIPKIEGHFEGKRTILTNFFQIASYMRRQPEHFQKFMLKELAASGQREGERFRESASQPKQGGSRVDRLILNIKVPSEKINQKIEQYAREFVLCKECGKPDTEILKEGRLTYIHCLACGAKHPVSKI